MKNLVINIILILMILFLVKIADAKTFTVTHTILLPKSYKLDSVKEPKTQRVPNQADGGVNRSRLSPVGSELWKEFKERARMIAKEENYPLGVLLGQAALETGRGTSYYAQARNNFFGINAVDWNPDLALSYESIDDGIRAYIRLIKNNYPLAYKEKDDPTKMIQVIKDYGYATDINYVAKILSMPEFKENENTDIR